MALKHLIIKNNAFHSKDLCNRSLVENDRERRVTFTLHAVRFHVSGSEFEVTLLTIVHSLAISELLNSVILITKTVFYIVNSFKLLGFNT